MKKLTEIILVMWVVFSVASCIDQPSKVEKQITQLETKIKDLQNQNEYLESKIIDIEHRLHIIN